ncbi:MAG: hypothetical protein Q4E36_01705 [Bacillota bacterium]|nr:hypothetical protein [Bacillota bacterium]
MEYINDLSAVYRDALKETGQVIKKVPYIILLPLGFSFINLVLYYSVGLVGSIIPGRGLLTGLIIALLEAFLLSAYFSYLDDTIHYKRFSLVIDNSLTRYWRSIYAVKFIFYLASLLMGRVLDRQAIGILIFIVLNPLGEAIYLSNRYGLAAIAYAFEYLKDNWYIWLPHTLAYLIISYHYAPFFLFSNPLSLYFSFPVFNTTVIVMTLLLGFYIVFRAVLFKATRNSSMRKRKYMGAWK